MAVEAARIGQSRLAQLVVVLVAAFVVTGVVWYGVSAEVRDRVWRDLIDRPGGPMTFRFILQPVMSGIAALHDGLEDARRQRSPYFWTLLTNPAERGGRLSEGVVSTARVILLGLVMDTIYQAVEFESFYPTEAVIVALVLAFIPYVLLRGPIARIARLWFRRASAS